MARMHPVGHPVLVVCNHWNLEGRDDTEKRQVVCQCRLDEVDHL